LIYLLNISEDQLSLWTNSSNLILIVLLFSIDMYLRRSAIVEQTAHSSTESIDTCENLLNRAFESPAPSAIFHALETAALFNREVRPYNSCLGI